MAACTTKSSARDFGRSSSTEQYAFLYDTAAIEVNRYSIYTVNDPDDLLHREPLVAMFRVRGPPPQQAFTFVLVNIHTDPDETDTELDALAQVYQAVRRSSGGEDDIILLGDLNVDDQHLGQLGRLDGVRPVVRGMFTNTRQNATLRQLRAPSAIDGRIHRPLGRVQFPATLQAHARPGPPGLRPPAHLGRVQRLRKAQPPAAWPLATRPSAHNNSGDWLHFTAG